MSTNAADLKEGIAARFSAAVRAARRKRGLNQQQAAEAAQISVATYRQIEQGRRLVGLVPFFKVCTTLDLSADQIIFPSDAVRAAFTWKPGEEVEALLAYLRNAPSSELAMVTGMLCTYECYMHSLEASCNPA